MKRLATPGQRCVFLLVVLMVMYGVLQAQLLDPYRQPKFVNPLPNPLAPEFIWQPTFSGGSHYEIGIFQFEQNLGLKDALGNALMTTVWGYGYANDPSSATYPGRTFLIDKGANPTKTITVHWMNKLLDQNGNPLPHLLPIDTSVHWALKHYDDWEELGVPVVTHLHGGHTEYLSDGLPDAWFTPNAAVTGRLYNPIYTYENDQEAATLWYHDHALGITRLNVYAGLAGFYLIRDSSESALNLPAYPYEVPLVIQDRMFTADGQLYYPSRPELPGAPDPSVLPEFFGNVILVNGKAWPYIQVEPRRYRFRILNGSDSRFYTLYLSTGQRFVQIGTDLGLLDTPVELDQLTLGPGERGDVIVDFRGYEGLQVVLRNRARTPFPNGTPPDPKTVGQIMAFKVGTTVTVPDHPVPMVLRPTPIVQLQPTAPSRQLLLFEGTDGYGRILALLGTAAEGAKMWDDAITETPRLNDIEVWEIFNTTPDAHPIHLHLVAFQIVNRQKFTATQDPVTGALTNIRYVGKPRPPAVNERGWKDTAPMYPGEVTRVIAKFDRLGEYVWHCHILSHEDHEMMRPYLVIPPLMPKPLAADADKSRAVELGPNYPEPFNPSTTISFVLPTNSSVRLDVYDLLGRRVKTLLHGELEAGTHSVVWNGVDENGSSLASGVYYYRLEAGTFTQMRKMMMVK